MKKWLSLPLNERLSVRQLFESLDTANHGELRLKDFENALGRLGMKCRQNEL
jgi:hypothetical protein